MAEAVRVKKTKTKSHKSKTKEMHDKENVRAQVKDIEESDISVDTRLTVAELKAGETVPEQEKPSSSDTVKCSIQEDPTEDRTAIEEGTNVRITSLRSTTETSTTNTVPNDESFDQKGTTKGNTTESCTAEEINVFERTAEPLEATTAEACASEPAEASIQCPVEHSFSKEGVDIQLHDITELTVNVQNVALTDVKTDLEEASQVSGVSSVQHEMGKAIITTRDASLSPADTAQSRASTKAEVTVLSDNVQLPREPQLNGRLGVVLAESFANASAPEHIICTDAVVGEGQVAETTTTNVSQLRLSEYEIPSAAAAAVVHRKLYPSLAVESAESLRPFTDEQLRTLYYNHELEHVDEYVDGFLQKSQQERHEFHEIIRSYYRARNHLWGAKHDIDCLQREAKKYQDLTWDVVIEKITVQGLCQDKYKVVGELTSERAMFREEVSNQLDRTLKAIRNHIHDDLSLYAYEAQLSRLQVESYMSRLYSAHLALSDIPPNYPVQAFLAHQRDPSVTHQVEALKSCISVLFAFQRKPTKDNVFTKDVRQWLSLMVGTLLRLATLEDHLFLLNHVLRCPAGVAKWAVSFIQPVEPPVTSGRTSFGGPLLDHFTTMLAVILLPVRQREDMLYQLKVSFSAVAESATEGQWIIVDSDGEEDEDPNNSWHYLQENDIVCLLNQFPLYQIFDHILLFKDENGSLQYDAIHTSETSLLKLFAYATCLIRLLGQGLQNFTLGRYRQLNKRIGRMIRHIVQYTCDHWINFRSAYAGLSSSTLERLQLESDMVLQRAVICILSACRLGSWQFLTELPYKGVSISVLWNLFRLMHQGCYKMNTSHLKMDIAIELCKLELTDIVNEADFHDKLTRLPTSEALFLLNTFANMARSRSEDDREFIEFVSGEIHEIAYVSSHTREFCSKPGRELLATVCFKHPFVISFLLHCTSRNMDKIGMVSHYLYRGLPLHLWKPTDMDFVVLRRWLIDHDNRSAENQLARILIEHLNWSFSSMGDELFLQLSLHQEMASLLMDVSSTHLAGKNLGKLFTDGQKQASPHGKVTVSEDQQLANWIWGTALRLHLHGRSLSQTGNLVSDSAVDMATNVDLQSIVSGLLSESRISLASYFVLVMTRRGHSISEFLSEGIQHLSHLVEKSYFIPAIQCIYYITPMFFEYHLSYLTSNAVFMQCIQTILQTDSSRKSYFSFDSSRPVAHTFSSMIEHQIFLASTSERPAHVVILFWLKMLTQLQNWNKEREVIYVVDNIIKSSFCHPEAFSRVQDLFLELTKSHSPEIGSGFLSSIASWLGSSGKVQSLMEQTSNPEFVWFAFAILTAETYHLETESSLWQELQRELIQNPALTVEQAMPKALSSLKMESGITPFCLGIYRWAYQAVETPIGHPLLPLLWQKFMLAYLGRCVIGSGLPQRGSVGDRFFVTSANTSLMKRMKKRLKESADHYRVLVTQASSGQGQVPVLSAATRELYENLIRLNLTLSFWLDEPRLHDSALYIPALPEQYQGQLLVGIFQNQREHWKHFIDVELIERDLVKLGKEWSAHLIQPQPNARQDQGTRGMHLDDETTESLISRLERNRTEVVAAPPVQTPKSSIPDLNPSLLLDKQNLLYTLRTDFESMVDHARLYAVRVAKHVDLDCTFIEFLHRLFVNVMTEGVLTVPCRSTFNPTHQCKGPAILTCLYENRKRDEIVSRKIEENRASYKQLLIESLLTPPQNLCCAAVRVENTITGLVNLRHSTKDPAVKDQLIQVGTALFYVMTSHISDDTKFYPPTRQFFSTCIELLGQEFIRNNPTQSQALLQTILQTPALVGLLAPNFCPNANPELFVAMYEDMIAVPSCQGVDVAFTLLTKFDVPQWLESNRPMLSKRTSLIDCIMKALCICGPEPNQSITLVFQVYRVHLQQLLHYQFPDHYGYILKALLKGSLDGQLCPSVWQDFLISLDPKQRSNSLEGFSYYKKFPQVSPCILPKGQIKECMEFLSAYFFRLRVSNDDAVTFGLYPKWGQYVTHLAQLLSHLASSSILDADTTNRHQSGDAEQVVGELFNENLDLFSAWILPLNNNGQILLPWTLNDDSMAADMVAAWVDSVDLLYRTFEECLPALSRNALILLWSQYVTSFTIKGLPENLLRVVHDRLVMLPWPKLFPDLKAVELMVTVIDCTKSCFEFLGNIFTLLDWPSIMKFYCLHELPEITTRLHISLFTLLVHLGQEAVIVEKTCLPQILSSDIFDWNYLDGQNYQTVVQWFINVCQPQCIMIEKTASASQVLTLLKNAASFRPNPLDAAAEHPEAPVKRCSYVRCIIQLICRSSYLKDVRSEALGIILNNLMTEVEGIVASIADPMNQYQEAVVLSTEILCLFNNCNPQGNMSADILKMALQWIESSALSVMLLPLLTSSCRCLVSMSHMVIFVEACIDTHFSLDVTQTDELGWTKVLSVLQVPELNANDFLKAALQQGCYLTLYAYILQKLPLSQALSDELIRLNQLVEWTSNAKPSAENESKLLLWWQKIFELGLRQIDFGGDQRPVVRALLTLVSSLITLGEDKSSTGFLGAIGLGRKSALSLRFRLVCKGLAAYLSAQIPSNLALRLESNAPGYISTRGSPSSPPGSPSGVSPSQQAQQAVAHLESLRTNKQYASFKQHTEMLINIVCDPRNSFRSAIQIFKQMASPLFPDFFYLAVIHRTPL